MGTRSEKHFFNQDDNIGGEKRFHQISYKGRALMMIQNIPAATKAVAGMVSSQAVAISWATVQRTLFTLSAAPAPMIEELTTCVVLTGPPNSDAVKITTADANCEAKASTGRIL